MKKIKSSIYIAQEKLSTINETNYMTEKDYSRWYADPVEDAKFREEYSVENYAIKDAVEKARKRTKEQYEACQNINYIEEELGAENLRYEQAPPESYQIGGTHYVDMKVQPWAVIDTNFDHAQAKGFYRGNALKYIMRAGCKGPAKEDYQKALHYLEKLIEIL
jgi:phosphopantetheinyl transferase (holo-ACP synthase)